MSAFAQGQVRLAAVLGALVAVLLVLFAVVNVVHVPLLVDPRSSLSTPSVAAAAIGVGLLVADAVLPVPASVVMVALGATFGVAVGSALSVLGSEGAFALSFLIGHRARHQFELVVESRDLVRARALLQQWGVLAVVVSRPIPLLAETVAFTSGACRMRASVALGGALLGAGGPAIAFAYAGAHGASTADGIVLFVLVTMLAGVCWMTGRRVGPREQS